MTDLQVQLLIEIAKSCKYIQEQMLMKEENKVLLSKLETAQIYTKEFGHLINKVIAEQCQIELAKLNNNPSLAAFVAESPL